MKSLSVSIQMKATELYFHVVVVPLKRRVTYHIVFQI